MKSHQTTAQERLVESSMAETTIQIPAEGFRSEFWKLCRHPGVLLSGVLFLALLLRLPYLSERSIWFDEASSWRTSSFPFAEMIDSLRKNVHPPMHYLVLKAWVYFFGDSAVALRSLSVMLGIVTVLGMFLCSRELWPATGNDNISLLAGVLTSVSAFQVNAAIEARMYALGTALLAFSSWSLLKAIKTSRSGWYALYTILALAFLYTHNYAFFSIAAQFFFLFTLAIVSARKKNWAAAKRSSARLTAIACALVIGYLPWAWALYGQVSRVREDYWIEPLTFASLCRVLWQLFVPTSYLWSDAQVIPITICAFILLLVLFVFMVPRTRATYFILLGATTPVVLTVAISFWVPIVATRYFRFCHLFMLLAIVGIIGSISRSFCRNLAATLVVGFFSATYLDFWTDLNIPNRPGMRGAIDTIAQRRKTNEIVVATTPVHYFPALFYARQRFPVRLLEPLEPFLHYKGGPLVSPSDIITGDEYLKHLRTGVWVMSGSSLHEEAAGIGSPNSSNVFFSEYPYRMHPIWVARQREAAAEDP